MFQSKGQQQGLLRCGSTRLSPHSYARTLSRRHRTIRRNIRYNVRENGTHETKEWLMMSEVLTHTLVCYQYVEGVAVLW